jgi:hypothetical protein
MLATNRTALVTSEGIAAVHSKKDPFGTQRDVYKLHGVSPGKRVTLTSYSLTSQVVGDIALAVRGGTVWWQIGMEQWWSGGWQGKSTSQRQNLLERFFRDRLFQPPALWQCPDRTACT